MKFLLTSIIICTYLVAFTQNVGIGTITPTNKLQVVGSIRADTIAIGTGTSRASLGFSQTPGQKITFWDDGNPGGSNYGIGIVGGLMQIHAYSSVDNIGFGYGSSNAFTEVMRIKGNGNVGIGTISPANKLTVNGNADFTGNVGIGFTTPTYRLHFANSNNSLRIEGPASSGTSNKAISIGGFGNIEIDKPGTVAGRFTIRENGNTGINNNNPQNTLDVNGNINLTGNLKVNDATGSSGQVLTSNGSGSAPSWTTMGNIIQSYTSGITSFLALTGNTVFNLTNSALSITVTVPSRIIIFCKTINWKVCIVGNCETKWDLKMYLNGTYKQHYGVDGTKYSALNSPASLGTDHSFGPELFDIDPGTHSITFTGTNDFNEPTITFSAVALVIPR